MFETVRFEFWKIRDRLSHLLGGNAHVQGVFSRIYKENLWASPESRSGRGSGVTTSERLREQLPNLVRDYGVRIVLDAPCGDFNWIRHVMGSFEQYIGVDIVPSLIEENSRLYETPSVKFLCADITSATLPHSDLIVCRDCCIHLPTRLVYRLLRNFRATGAKYLLLSNDEDAADYHDIPIGSFRKINFLRAPFAFPVPKHIILEDDTGNRQICLWSLADLPI